jgi:predicted RNase H-like HicB family nuclease
MRFQVYIYQDEDGAFIAECPIIPGCVSDGTTFEEAEANIQEAIRECIELREELGLPPIMYRRDVEVMV